MTHHNDITDVVKGELIVVGKDKISIELKDKPQHVFVEFEGHECPVPCSPHHHDDLSWEVCEVNHHSHHNIPHPQHPHHHHNDKEYVLVISWNVSSVRKVFWQVSYGHKH